MKRRIITSVFGIPVLLIVLAVRGWVSEMIIVLAATIAINEYYRALFAAGYQVCTWGGYLAAVLMWPLHWVMGVLDPLLLIMGAMGVSMLGLLLGKNPTFPNAAATVYPLFACLMPFSMFMMMLSSTYGTVPGSALCSMTFFIAFGSDIMAFLGGTLYGKTRLCPQISPKKTVEGAVAGVLGGVLFSLLGRLFFVWGMRWPMPGVPAAILLGVLGAVAGQVGDLAASLLKRHAGLKDYGKIFPGHGGMMDRLDSVIFTQIVLYCYTLMLH